MPIDHTKLELAGRNSEIWGTPNSRNVFIQPVDEHDHGLMESETGEVQRICGHSDFCIVAYPVENWNEDLTPWEAEPVFGKQGFGSGAPFTLNNILNDVIPGIEKEYGSESRKYYICGYSLAGLFALWAGYQTDVFQGIVAASPSVWYKDWINYAASHKMRSSEVYLSLGDKEEKTKSPTMATVGRCIIKMNEILTDSGVTTTLEWNQGNHFKDSDIRTAKGMAWALQLQNRN